MWSINASLSDRLVFPTICQICLKCLVRTAIQMEWGMIIEALPRIAARENYWIARETFCLEGDNYREMFPRILIHIGEWVALWTAARVFLLILSRFYHRLIRQSRVQTQRPDLTAYKETFSVNVTEQLSWSATYHDSIKTLFKAAWGICCSKNISFDQDRCNSVEMA